MRRIWIIILSMALLSAILPLPAFAAQSPSAATNQHIAQASRYTEKITRPAVGIPETSDLGPAIVRNCADLGETVTFTGTDDRINTYSMPVSPGSNLVAQFDFSIEAPASVCYNNHTWIAYTGTESGMYLREWLNPSGILWSFYDVPIPAEYLYGSPALTVCGGTLYIGWADLNNYLNIMQLNVNSPSQSQVTRLTDYTRAYAGLSLACLNNTVYVAWVASSGTPHFYLGAYQPGNSQLRNSGPITSSDYAESHPAISASNTSGKLEFFWKGDTNTDLYTAYYTPSSGTWSGRTDHSNVGTLYTPAVDYQYTAYTGTDHKIYVDGVFFS